MGVGVGVRVGVGGVGMDPSKVLCQTLLGMQHPAIPLLSRHGHRPPLLRQKHCRRRSHHLTQGSRSADS